MIQTVIEKTQTLVKALLGTPSDWRLTKPITPRIPRVNYIWIGPVLAVITIFIGWFAFANTIGDGNAAFALFIGSVSIMMMTWSNLLSTRILPLEQIFGGVDRMYVWHRWFGALSVGAMWLHLEMVDDVKGIRGASKDIADAAEDLTVALPRIFFIVCHPARMLQQLKCSKLQIAKAEFICMFTHQMKRTAFSQTMSFQQ